MAKKIHFFKMEAKLWLFICLWENNKKAYSFLCFLEKNGNYNELNFVIRAFFRLINIMLILVFRNV